MQKYLTPLIVGALSLLMAVSAASAQSDGPEPPSYTEIRPLVRVMPEYPIRLFRAGIQGRVVVQFDLDERGHPVNVTVAEPDPHRAFNDAARDAIRRFRYEPRLVDGVPVIAEGIQYAFEFNIHQ